MGIMVDLQVNPENVGYRLNFDGALRACTGEIIFLCDQDDVWHADKLARFCAAFDARPGLRVLHCNARLIDEAGQPMPQTLFAALRYGAGQQARMHAGDGLRVLLKRKRITGAAMALHRSVLDDALPLPTSDWVHDAWIGTLAAMRDQALASQARAPVLLGAQADDDAVDPGLDLHRLVHRRSSVVVVLATVLVVVVVAVVETVVVMVAVEILNH